MKKSGCPRRGGQAQRAVLKARGGFSLTETIVALMLLSVGILGATSGGGAVVKQLGVARGDLGLWAAQQTVGDSLQERGYGGVTAASRMVGNYSFSWTLDESTPYLQKLIVAGHSTGSFAVADTMVIYLGSPGAP
jgi:prepilin-type N-terminal cleavage/methylation domain-containing protein